VEKRTPTHTGGGGFSASTIDDKYVTVPYAGCRCGQPTDVELVSPMTVEERYQLPLLEGRAPLCSVSGRTRVSLISVGTSVKDLIPTVEVTKLCGVGGHLHTVSRVFLLSSFFKKIIKI
jgi:hypothetical protein